MKGTVALAVILAVLITGTASAQVAATEADAWSAFAASHVMGAQVSVRLKDGHQYRGIIVAVDGDTFQFKPRTRVAVPAGTIAFADVDSMAIRQPGLSPGNKVLIGVGAAAGTILLAVVIAIAAVGY